MTDTIPQQLIVNQLVEFIKAPESSHFSLPAHATLKSGNGLATAVRVRRFDRYADGRRTLRAGATYSELVRVRARTRGRLDRGSPPPTPAPAVRDHPLPPLDFQNRPKSKPGGKMAFARACPLPALSTDLQTIAVVVRYFFTTRAAFFYALVLLMGMRSDNDRAR